MKNVFDVLEERGLVAQVTDKDRVRELLEKEKIAFYIGFDATADSLHIGHFLQMVVMKHMQDAGHTPVALLGGGTTMVGDPTGKEDMRKMLTKEQIDHNAECFRKQMSKFIDFGEGKAIMVDNGDWLLGLNYLQFLREVGVHFSVNRMLTMDSVKTRLEKGLSFMEFNYMILQSYDFLHLYKEHNVKMQFGGNDQWSNIIGGVELIRRKEEGEAFGVTFTLLTTKEGKKMGKTESGTIWLDPEKTTPYEFFQYWRNIDDVDLTNCMRLLTNIDLKEIDEYENANAEKINSGKELLAFELTKLVHNEEEAEKALNTSKSLFSGKVNEENMPSTKIEEAELVDGKISILDLLISCELANSKSEGRRLIEQGGLTLNEVKVTSLELEITVEELQKAIVMKKGKKIFHKAYI